MATNMNTDLSGFWHILGTEHVYIARPPYWHRISIFQYWHRDAVSKAIRHEGNREYRTRTKSSLMAKTKRPR